MNISGYDQKVTEAVQSFWSVRKEKGVRSGKTLDAFVDILSWVTKNNGLPEAYVVTGKKANIPGFFRPVKSWDTLIFHEEILIAAVELKSIVDSSVEQSNNFGKNSNNRNEEALGSGIDIKEAFEENAFEGLTRLFTGYLILVEDCDRALKSVKIEMDNFRVMKEFMLEPENRQTKYVRNNEGTFPAIDGVSYMERFDLLCRRLMQKKLYTAASVVKSPKSAINDGEYDDVSNDTSIKSFLASLASHVETMAIIMDN